MTLSFDPFEAGPRLTDTPRGDAVRQIDALRGYAFQLCGSALAWLGLDEGEQLYLEVAEDYAVAAADALRAVQAKDTEDRRSRCPARRVSSREDLPCPRPV